jgi:4-amino-4-deoxy-L-arabinose transferase-like glycosyltransferase
VGSAHTGARSCARQRALPLIVWISLAGATAGLVAYSQTFAYSYDEGFHLLAAQLVMNGKRLYLDFFYQHPPMFVLLNVPWMRVFGDTWRSAHLLSALFTAACALLIARFIWASVALGKRGAGVAACAVLLLAGGRLVLFNGTIGQPYALALFFLTASFVLTVRVTRQSSGGLAFWAGAAAGAAACSSLLAAACVLVLFAWLVIRNQTGSRARKAIQFMAGGMIPFAPLLPPLVRAPRVVLFDLIEYHLWYRGCPGHFRSWFGALTSSGETVLLLALAALGLWFVTRGPWKREEKDGCYLAACLVASHLLYMLMIHNVFCMYFVLMMPFVVLLASVGMLALFANPRLQYAGMAAIAFALAFMVAGQVTVELPRQSWKELEVIARQVDQAAPRDGWLYAYEALYFLSRRVPPPGLENPYGLDIDAARAKPLHLVSQAQVAQWIKDGRFSAVLVGVELPATSLDLKTQYKRFRTMQVTLGEPGCLLWNDAAGQPPAHGVTLRPSR